MKDALLSRIASASKSHAMLLRRVLSDMKDALLSRIATASEGAIGHASYAVLLKNSLYCARSRPAIAYG
eukprot:1193191-Rhodomonas_salina.1